MVNAAKFGNALRSLAGMVAGGSSVTQNHLVKLVNGTNLKPTPAVMAVVRRAVDFAKSNCLVVDGRVVEVSREHHDSVRGKFFFVHLAGSVYRCAMEAADTEYWLSHPPPQPAPDDWSDLEPYFIQEA